MPSLINDLPLAFTLPDYNLWEMLAIPLGALVMVAAVLWTGRIRQRLLVNVLALGIMMPLVHLCMITAGAHLRMGHRRRPRGGQRRRRGGSEHSL